MDPGRPSAARRVERSGSRLGDGEGEQIRAWPRRQSGERLHDRPPASRRPCGRKTEDISPRGTRSGRPGHPEKNSMTPSSRSRSPRMHGPKVGCSAASAPLPGRHCGTGAAPGSMNARTATQWQTRRGCRLHLRAAPTTSPRPESSRGTVATRGIRCFAMRLARPFGRSRGGSASRSKPTPRRGSGWMILQTATRPGKGEAPWARPTHSAPTAGGG